MLTAMHVDSEGFLWVSEIRGLAGQDPEDASYDFILRKLDNTGSEIEVVDLSDLVGRNDLLYVRALSIDDTGNIYLVSGTDIYILDNNGSLLFTLDNPDFLGDFVRFTDGRIAFPEWDFQQGRGIYLKIIDMERRSWGKIINLPSSVPNIQNIFPGFGEYLFIYNDRSFLNGFNAETGEHEALLSWVGSNLSSEDINAVLVLPDGRIAATRQPLIAPAGDLPAKELILLTISPADASSSGASIAQQSDRIELLFATFDYDSSRRFAVELFNRNSDTHRITVVDYSQFNTDDDWTIGLTRLTTEIIAGNVPDILDMWYMPLHDYISKELLLDLYPFLDADPEVGRDSIVESVLNASEINGSLYRIVPSLYINTVLGDPSVLGDYPGWNTDEFVAVLDANPGADLPLGPYNDKMSFFIFAVRYNIDKYIDRDLGIAYFDSDDFIKILELSNTFPAEADHNSNEVSHLLIADGRQIMHMWSIFSIVDYVVYREMFGGDLVFKGFPAENRDGNAFIPLSSLAITTSSAEPDAAWDFLRIFITEAYQRNQIIFGFPVNRVAFDERVEEYTRPFRGGIGTSDGFQIEMDSVDGIILFTQEDVDRINDFVDSITRMHSDDRDLWRIVREGAEDFFNGRTTAQDAARVIQNRASIYLSEQTG